MPDISHILNMPKSTPPQFTEDLITSNLLESNSICISYAELPLLSKDQSNNFLWVQIAAEVIGSAIKMSKEQDFKDWQKDVSGKLDEVLAGLAAIQEELRNLRVWFDDRISEETRRQYHQRITSVATDVNRIIVAIGSHQNNLPTRDQLDDLSAHFRDLRVTIDSLCNTDGYTHIMGVVAGAVVALPLFQLLNRRNERQLWASSMSRYFGEAVNPANEKSIEYARNNFASEYLVAKNDFDGRLNVFWKTNYEPGFEGNDRITESTDRDGIPSRPARFIRQKATGDINIGVSLSSRSATETGEGPSWYPNLTAAWRIYSGPDAPWSEMNADLESRRQCTLALGRQISALVEKIVEVNRIKSSFDSII